MGNRMEEFDRNDTCLFIDVGLRSFKIQWLKCEVFPAFYAFCNIHIDPLHKPPKIEECNSVDTPSLCNEYSILCEIDMICISIILKCDGNFDCQDKTDEKNCSTIKQIIYPQSNQLINPFYMCNYFQDYSSAEDEKFCFFPNCKENERKCLNHECISIEKFCDNERDCIDFSDEKCYDSL
ncbi:DgyrCDS14560 [Dimorphilus gyrociliatus]|uniref:DgyrCDS14560 n=1 Tax=Dimorphilus gyrociliatus TaxID=2664684 RepID=A0A7I8WED8_9ANNE|nr:DgyrCDS14560 [Dimorphilus gyrociliatus]